MLKLKSMELLNPIRALESFVSCIKARHVKLIDLLIRQNCIHIHPKLNNCIFILSGCRACLAREIMKYYGGFRLFF